MKQRFSSLDVKVIAHELSATLTSLRVTNIYDLSSRIFLLKLHKPDQRERLVVDCGFRCHLTSFARETASTPSPFVVRLRKFLRSRRITSVSQVGTDRVIEFQFSDGQYRLFLEFYAAGNIVLTDGDLKILALFRNVSEGAEHEQLRVGLQYNLELRQNYNGVPALTKERVRSGLQKAIDRRQDGAAPGKKAKKKAGDALRKALAVSINEYPPMLVDHAFQVKEFDPNTKPEEVLQKPELLDRLLEVLKEADSVIAEITSSDVVKGFILAKDARKPSISKEPSSEAENEQTKSTENLAYDDFHPFKPRQFEDDPANRFLEIDGFNKTVDEFFSSIEGQKLESKLHEREEAAKRKLEQARQDHQKRIGGLQQTQELNIRRAEAIEANIERVGEATAAVNGLIAQGMDWVDIARLIETEQKRNNPVAEMVKLPLKLYENTVTLLLAERSLGDEEDIEGSETESEPSDSDSDDESVSTRSKRKVTQFTERRLAVDIDLGLTAWANASQYYDQKKTAVVKEEKTVQASTKALKSAEQKITADLRKGLKQEKEVLRPVRKQFWFEKFMYFISSDGYLVIGGKDAQQNEILYRRYLRKGDIYVHADMHGAATIIVKNNPSTPDAPIPPSTLSQAGNLSVATSNAWDSKAVMSAWWVNSDQVSKTAPTGEYLTTGGFMVRGKKNFLPPAQLLLGFAVMFEISEESKAKHVKHRIMDAEEIDGRANDAIAAANEPVERAEESGEAEIESDEDFPNAKLEGADEDSDEDFPDAKLDSAEENSDDGTDADARPANPLQFGSQKQSDSLQKVAHTDESDAAEVDDSPPTFGENTGETADSAAKSSSRHLSAKERRLLRKGQTSAPISGAPAAASEPGNHTASRQDTPFTKTTSPSKPTPLPRGKRGKQKKLASKYADQDEEDRALAMRLLGSKTGQEAAVAEAEAKKSKVEEEAAQKARRREQHMRVQAEGKKAEDARRAAHGGEGETNADDEPLENDDEAARLSLLGLDALIGRPLVGDELLTAIPVCAPWSALSNYKYKAKMQPGAQKKGKAVKEILGAWDAAGKVGRNVDDKSVDGERMWPREVELIKAWKDTEVLGVVPVGKVRVMMAGGSGGSRGVGKGKGKAGRGGRGSKKK